MKDSFGKQKSKRKWLTNMVAKVSDSRVIAIIPARGGSKGIKGKNIYPLMGKPLISYTYEAAVQSKLMDQILVTTDCDEIGAVSQKLGALVIHRPIHLSTDTAKSVDAVLHALNSVDARDADIIVLLQPTSPLRTADDIERALERFRSGSKNGSVISVVEPEHHPLKALIVKDGALSPLRQISDLSSPRQVLPKAFQPNGAIYIARAGNIRAHSRLILAPIQPFEMPLERSRDIDVLDDIAYCESYMMRLKDMP